jgi:hypothetical protein
MEEKSDWVNSTMFPQQIGPVKDNPTIAYMLSAHVSYQ